jgi:hypothetical protein
MTAADAARALLAVGSFAAPAAFGEIAPLAASELYASCRIHRDEPDDPAGASCTGYLRGLLDATERIVGVEDAGSSRESFRDRALRTRAGSRQLGAPRYCLEASVSLEQIIVELLANRVSDAEGTTAATAVYRTLQRLHACRLR